MFNNIEVYLVPHCSIILLYSFKVSLLNIYHAKLYARTCSISLSEKRKSMSMCWAQVTQYLYKKKRQINFNGENKGYH